MRQVVRALHNGDVATFVRHLQSEPWLLRDSGVGFQVGLVGRATAWDRAPFISALFDLDPALLRRRPPPHSQALELALAYTKPHLLPILTRVRPIPNDLAHAAGMGDLNKVKAWFDSSGKPALGDLANHFPCNDAYARGNLQWGAPRAQQAFEPRSPGPCSNIIST